MKYNYKSRNMALVLLAILVFVSVALVACQPNEDTQILVAVPEGPFTIGQSFSVSMVFSDGSTPVLSVDEKYNDLVKVEGNRVTVIGNPNEQKTVELKISAEGNAKLFKIIEIVIAPASGTGSVKITTDNYTIGIGKPATLTLNPAGDYDVSYSLDDGESFSATCDYLTYSKTTGKLSLAETPDTDTPVIVKFVDKADQSKYGTITLTVKGAVNISLSLDKTEIGNTESAILTATADGGAELEVTCGSSLVEIVSKDSGKYEIKVKGQEKILFDQEVSITAKVKDNDNIKKSISLTLKQTRSSGEPVRAGETGISLTKEWLNAISNPSITATGTLSDKTQETANKRITSNNYDMQVIMETDRWYGQWNIASSSATKIITRDTYIKSATETAKVSVYDTAGNFVKYAEGPVMEREYIDINNKLASKVVTDYQSIPALWETQHLWNHLTSEYMNVDTFRYSANYDTAKLNELGFVSGDANDDTLVAFQYNIPTTNMQALELFTYICQSLTPLADTNDVLETMYLVCDKNGIVGIYAITEVYKYWGTEDNTPVQDGSPISTSWTEICLTFSDIGTSEVPDPTPYKLDTTKPVQSAAYEYLQDALESIKGVKNYTFVALDNATSTPSFDDDDYTLSGGIDSGATGGSTSGSGSTTHSSTFYDHKDSVGISGGTDTGTVGYVVANTSEPYIIIESVGKYSYGMDDNLYHFTYTGYRGFSDGTYEEFAYDATLDGFKGTRLVKKDIATVLPTFDFAAEIFEFDGYEVPKETGLDTYSFRLKDNALTFDVVQQFSLDGTRNSAATDAQNTVKIRITVDADNKAKVYSTSYPYSFAGGAYAGTIETYYKNIGTTDKVVDSTKVFANYERRVLPETWADIKHGGANSKLFPFYYLHTSDLKEYPGVYDKETEKYDQSKDPILSGSNMEYVINRIFGNAAKYMPAPSFFLGLFDDNMSGPWYDYTANANLEDGYIDMIKFVVQVGGLDENKVLSNKAWQSIVDSLKSAFSAWNTENGMTEDNGGWKYSGSMSTPEATTDDDMSGRYLVFVSDGLTIVFNNIHTGYIYISVYTTGEWSRTND